MVQNVKASTKHKAAASKGKPAVAEVAALPAVPVMIGTHFHALDEKGRVIIPSKLRSALTEKFWMMISQDDNIDIYNYQTGLDVFKHCERLMAQNPSDLTLAEAVRRLTSTAQIVTVEGNWRVAIDEVLRFHAGLEKEVVTEGVLNHAVLWERKRWEEAQANTPVEDEVRKVQGAILRAAASGVLTRNERNQSTSDGDAQDASSGDDIPDSIRSRLSQLGR